MYSPSTPSSASCTPDRKNSATISVAMPGGAALVSSRLMTSWTKPYRIDSAAMPKPVKMARRIGALVNEIIPFSPWSTRPKKRFFDRPARRSRHVYSIEVDSWAKPMLASMPRM